MNINCCFNKACIARQLLIIISLQTQADTAEEAEAQVARHREEDGAVPITVYKKGSRQEEVLARWDPGLPEWLRGDEEETDVS